MNQSHESLHSIKEVVLLYKRLYGKELDLYDMIELAPIVLRATGSIASRTFLLQANIVSSNGVNEIDLPCNVYAIKSVTANKPINWYGGMFASAENVLVNYRVDQSGNLGIYNPDSSQSEILGSDVLYEVDTNVIKRPWGTPLDFQNNDNKCLTFNYPSGKVDIVYVGGVFDAEGFLKIPEKTVLAIASFMNFVDVQTKFYQKLADRGMLAEAKEDKERRIAQARTPSFLSSNEMDMALNVFTSSNKKQHNVRMRG